MVDRKITEFTELTTVTNLDSVVAVVDIDEALPVDQNKKITVSNLISSGSNRSFAQNVGNGIDNAYTITHNLGTMDLNVTVRENSLPFARVFPDVQFTTANTIILDFGMSTPTLNEFRVFIDAGSLGGGVGVNQFIDTVGNAVDTSIVVNHNLDFQNVVVQVYENTSPFSQVFPEVQLTDDNNVTLVFVSAPSTDEFRVIITGGVGGVVTSNVVVGGGEPYVEINSGGTLPIATGTDAIVIGPGSSTGQSTAVVIGEGAGSAGTAGIAIGDGAVAGDLGGTLPNGNNAIALGTGAVARANGSVQLGAGTNFGSDTFQWRDILIADDESIKVTVTAGTPTQTWNTGALAVDSTNDILYFRSSGTWNAAGGGGGGEDYFADTYTGTFPSATGTNALAIGRQATSAGVSGVAIGNIADAANLGVVAIGQQAFGVADYAVAIGLQADAEQDSSIAIGRVSKAFGIRGVAIGQAAEVRGTESVSIGYDTIIGTGSDRGVCIGNNCDITPAVDDAIVIGSSSIAGGDESIAIGQQATASDQYAISIGEESTAAGLGSVAIGEDSSTTLANAVALGRGTVCTGTGGVAIGVSADSLDTDAIAIGNATQANGNRAIAIGGASTTTADFAIVIGDNADADGPNSISIGDGADTTATADRAIAIGNGAAAGEDDAVIIGNGASNTIGVSAIAIGNGAVANNNDFIIAIGDTANCQSRRGIAIGRNTTIGSAVIEGNAIGEDATCSGNRSFQLGRGTNSNSDTIQFQTQPIANTNGIEVKNAAAAPTGTPRVGTLYLDTSSGNGTLHIYSNGAWRTVAVL